MITQQPEQEIQQKAQAPSPVKQHRWVVVLFSILGVALPLVAGSVPWWPWGVPDFMDSSESFFTVLLTAAGSVAVGAFLLCFAFRVWWVAVFAVVAWIVGEVLSAVVRTIVEGSSSQLLAWGYSPFQLGLMGSALGLGPLLICAGIGALAAGLALGKWREWQQQPPPEPW